MGVDQALANHQRVEPKQAHRSRDVADERLEADFADAGRWADQARVSQDEQRAAQQVLAEREQKPEQQQAQELLEISVQQEQLAAQRVLR